jgi:predicted nucleotidyltransferase
MKHVHSNIVRIKAVHDLLGNLKDKVVYVGGATVSLYAQREAPEIRETKDVDILVEIATNWDYAAVEEQLRKIGFKNDQNTKFVGRYILEGLIVDLMATDEKILGFSNIWYKEGFQTAIDHRIDDQVTVKIFDCPHFIASKIEAFKNRGEGDGRLSSDFEDIIFILDNRTSVWEEMEHTASPLKEYLKKEFKIFADSPYIEEWIGSHSSFYSPPSSYLILKDMKQYLEN